ncbi:hypothetical protein VDGL01_10540 [Verticillium dahliae]
MCLVLSSRRLDRSSRLDPSFLVFSRPRRLEWPTKPCKPTLPIYEAEPRRLKRSNKRSNPGAAPSARLAPEDPGSGPGSNPDPGVGRRDGKTGLTDGRTLAGSSLRGLGMTAERLIHGHASTAVAGRSSVCAGVPPCVQCPGVVVCPGYVVVQMGITRRAGGPLEGSPNTPGRMSTNPPPHVPNTWPHVPNTWPHVPNTPAACPLTPRRMSTKAPR